MTAKFIVADVFDGLASLETGSVDVVITSPPFLALRSYLPADHADKSKEIGSEATPAEFIDTLLKVTAELRRVLAPHGSICVELGDTYAGSGGAGGDYNEDGLRDGQQKFSGSAAKRVANGVGDEYRPARSGRGNAWPLSKSRTLIPSLYQIALAYGFNPLTGQPSPAGQWRIRNIVTWARPNPPVGALGDKWRPATSDLVIACTSGKRYWDDLATRKPHQSDPASYSGNGYSKGSPEGIVGNESMPGNISGAPLLDYWELPTEELVTLRGTTGWAGGEKSNDGSGRPTPAFNTGSHPSGAPLLDYWVIPPGGYTGAHYAVFPEELVVPCVQAMCPQRVCLTCGEPSRRIVSEPEYVGSRSGTAATVFSLRTGLDNPGVKRGTTAAKRSESGTGDTSIIRQVDTLGWSDCGHDNWRPGLVLDPFAGSGTTLAVATGHGHDAIGIDIDSRNAELARDRVGPFLFEMVDISVPTP